MRAPDFSGVIRAKRALLNEKEERSRLDRATRWEPKLRKAEVRVREIMDRIAVLDRDGSKRKRPEKALKRARAVELRCREIVARSRVSVSESREARALLLRASKEW